MRRLTNEPENGSSPQLNNTQSSFHNNIVDIEKEDTAQQKETQYKILARLNEDQVEDDFDKQDMASEMDETLEYSQKFIEAMYQMVKQRYGEEAGRKIVEVAENANAEKSAFRAQSMQSRQDISDAAMAKKISESSSNPRAVNQDLSEMTASPMRHILTQIGANRIVRRKGIPTAAEKLWMHFKMEFKKFRYQIAAITIVLIAGASLSRMGVQATRLPQAKISQSDTMDYSTVGTPEDIVSMLDMTSYPQQMGTLYKPNLILQDYIQTEYNVYERSLTILYEDLQNENNWYQYQQTTVSAVSFLDTEQAEWKKVDVDGYLGFFVADDNLSKLWWFDYQYAYQIFGNLTKDEMLDIAKSLVEVKD